jgi:hypothetical protein
MSEVPGNAPSGRSQRFLRATLPIGIVLTMVWVVLLVVDIAIGDAQHGFSIATAILGLVSSLALIVSGLHYRRGLRRP